MVSFFGGPGAEEAYNFEARQYVPLHEGAYRLAERVLHTLEEENIPSWSLS